MITETAFEVIVGSIRVAKTIHDICIHAKNCRSFLGLVGDKLQLIIRIMEDIENYIETLDVDQAQSILHSISTLYADVAATKDIVEKAANMGRIVFIVHSKDIQLQMDRRLSALHLTLMGLQTSQNTSIARKVDDFHIAWSDREDELRKEADKEMALRSRLSEASLQPLSDENRKCIADMVGIDVAQLNEELEQVKRERDLMKLQLMSSSASHDAIAKDKAKVEAILMDQIISALSMPEASTSPAGPPNTSLGQIPQECLCPITSDVMDDPVIVDASCNHTLSRQAARRWFDMGHKDCPVCHAATNSSRLAPNVPLRGIIESIRPLYCYAENTDPSLIESTEATTTVDDKGIGDDNWDQQRNPRLKKEMSSSSQLHNVSENLPSRNHQPFFESPKINNKMTDKSIGENTDKSAIRNPAFYPPDNEPISFENDHFAFEYRAQDNPVAINIEGNEDHAEIQTGKGKALWKPTLCGIVQRRGRSSSE